MHRLKQEFPQLTIVINGGLKTMDACREQLSTLDGVMLGREPYENPWMLAAVDATLFGAEAPAVGSREQALRRLRPYIERERAEGTPLAAITRHVLGLYRGQPGGRAFRRVLSERAPRAGAGWEVVEAALEAVNAATPALSDAA